jgi:transglutaminase-like putative cysteine protease
MDALTAVPRTNRVGCQLTFDVTAPATIVLQVAVAGAAEADLRVTHEGVPAPVSEFGAPHGGHRHLVRAEPGELTLSYAATVAFRDATPRPAPDQDRFEALVPSRYCPSDRLVGFAQRLFGTRPADRIQDLRDYVYRHLGYAAATSGPTTDAVDTLLSAQGVCRDFAHLMVTLCRAVNVPARVASVYAPGLSPMDFHLVAETATDEVWHVWDATGLAPRPTLVRIATGRDAADVAFATVTEGAAELTDLQITAVVDGDLPEDDHTGLAVLL